MMRSPLIGCLALAGIYGIACEDSASDPSPPEHVALTDELAWTTINPRLDGAEARNPTRPEQRSELLAAGYGDEQRAAGEPHVARALTGEVVPTPSRDPTLLVRFVHFADMQLTDDESPARTVNFDAPGPTAGAFRPQETWGCRLVNAMVDTLVRLHAERPLDFVLLGGDNIDNAQRNELDWVLTLLGESPATLMCDSGERNDIVPGPDNDPKDPFEVVGLGDIPWYWVTGNHDLLVQGNFPTDEDLRATAIGEQADFGTRDWRLPGGPVVTDPVPADPERALLSGPELLARVAADGDGHGLGAVQAASGKAFYTFDVPAGDLRFVVIDSAAPTGGSRGVLRRGDVDSRLIPLLDQALNDGHTVIITAHHAVTSLGDGSGLGGVVQPDALSQDEFVALVTGYPNIVLSLVGHSHQHRIRELVGPTRSLFEVTTAALADYPHQARLVEIWREGGGWLRVRLTSIDFDGLDDPVVAEGRRLGVMDWVAGWADENASGPEDRNVDLWVRDPMR